MAGLCEYRLMIQPAGDLEDLLKAQLKKIAGEGYHKETDKVIFRVRTTNGQTNPRKLFIPGDGRVIGVEILPHITLSQKIVVNEDREGELVEIIKEIAHKISHFALTSTKIGDYGEDFTIFLAFEQSPSADRLVELINSRFGRFFSAEREKRDVLHTTLIYDDADSKNIEKAAKIIEENKLVGCTLPVDSLWLWKNQPGGQPCKEFRLG